MMEFIQNFHFLRPWLLLFLLVPGFIYFLKLKKLATISSWEDVCDKKLLTFLLVTNGATKKISILKFIYIGLIFASLAAAGPAWKKIEIPAISVENPNMFIISLAQDMQLRDISPSRLDRAKFMLSDITDNINQGQFGIEVYSQEPYTITPFTEDIQLIKNILPQIVPDIVPDQGDRLDRAIDLAIERFKAAGYASGNIILFASDVGQRFDQALEKARKALANNFSLHVIDTSFGGNEKLQLLAETGHGIYLRVQETSPYKLTEYINNVNQKRMTQSDNTRSNFADYGYYLVFIVLFCVLPFFRKGLLLLMFCCFSLQAHASFWLNEEQEGLAYFRQEKYDDALKKFKMPNWRGVTLYKQNKLEEALKEFEKSEDPEDLYNKGVVLTKLCQYQEAFTFFEKALMHDPQNMDALYNKQLIADLLEKAKEDPSVLDCSDNQDTQQDKNNQNNDNENQEEQSQNSQKQDEQQKESSSDENKNNTNDQQQNESSATEDTPDNQSQQQNNQNNADNSETPNEGTSETEKDKQDSGANHQQQDNQTNSENNESDVEQANGAQQEAAQQTQLVNAKEGNQDEKYDEEALALQRRYREIPEDIGGLLREFIKKEYLKDRYHNEVM